MIDCVFENNTFYWNDSLLYNVIYMTDNSYGNIVINDSIFIGDYLNQPNISQSWLFDENKNSSFQCNNCQFRNGGLTTTPTRNPSQQPTYVPTIYPTKEPTQTPTIDSTPNAVNPTIASTTLKPDKNNHLVSQSNIEFEV